MSEHKDVWVYLEHNDGRPADVSLELIGKARELAGKLGTRACAVVLGDGVEQLAQEAVAFGADVVYAVSSPRLKNFSTLPFTKVLCDLAQKHVPEIFLMGATTTGRDLGPRVSARLFSGLTADCTALEIGDHEEKTKNKKYKNLLKQIRPAFGGNIIATIVNPENRPQMATVRPGVMPRLEPDPKRRGEIVHEEAALGDADCPVEIIERVTREKGVNLASARIIVAGGAGVGSRENFKLLFDFARVIGGEVGASRAAVDAGWVAHDRQVGQTGTTVRPQLYIACGISGAIQHRAGMLESGKIIAINDDPSAPIFGVAHVGIVGNVAEIVPMFIEAYRKKGK